MRKRHLILEIEHTQTDLSQPRVTNYLVGETKYVLN